MASGSIVKSHARVRLAQRGSHFRWLASRLGFLGACRYLAASRRRGRATSGVARLSALGVPRSLTARLQGSDLTVFQQVFIDAAYRSVESLGEIRTILDLGANVGFTAARLLSCYPHARLLAVEPSDDNVAVLRENLAPFGDRAMVLHGAVWPVTADLVIDERPYRDGSEWARQVRAARPGESGAFRGWAPGDLITRLGGERVSLLKMDVEGTEAALFAHPDLSWLDRIDHLAIELHDDSIFGPATPLFDAAVASRPHRRTQEGETTVCHFSR
jgi:FkbM family methyltransferase